MSIVYLFIATVILSKNKNYIPTLAKVVILSVTILSLIGVYQYLRYFYPTGEPCNITGTMAQRNQFSSSLFLMLPFCLYACLCLKIIWRIISIIPMVLGVTLILLNHTRSVWLGIFVSTVVTTIVALESKAFFLRSFLCVMAVLIVTGTIFGYLYSRSNSIETVLDKRDGNDDGWRVVLVNGRAWISVDAIDVISAKADEITDTTTWHHIVAVVDRDGNGQMYIDGVASGPAVAISSEVMSITAALHIAKDLVGSNHFTGGIDNVMIYDKALSPAEVEMLYNEQLTLTVSSSNGGTVTTPGEGDFNCDPAETVPIIAIGLAAHWKMDDNVANAKVVDSSVNSNEGTLNDAGGTARTAFHSTNGKINTALAFDGFDDYIGVFDSGSLSFEAATADFSVSLWLKRSTSNSIDSLIDRAKSIYSPQHKSNAIRLSMWQHTLAPVRDNFILGVGPGNWKIAFPSYGIEDLPREDMFKTTFFVRPENDYVWILSEIGILGFIFYLSIFGIIFGYVFKILTQHPDTSYKTLSILIFFGIVGYMVISCFTFPRERIFHSMFLLLMMAIVISIYHQSFGVQKNFPRLFMLALAIPCLCLLLFAIFIGYTRLNAEIHTKRAFAARKAKVWPAVISEIDKGYSVFATLDPMSIPLKWYRGEAGFLLNNIPEALEDFKEAYKAHPYHIHVLNNLATCYEMTGNHNLAINYYNKALEIYPEFEDALINLGAAYYNAGRYEESHETLLRCSQNEQNPRLQQYLKAVEKKLDKKEHK
jgi:hypothetical protein